MKIYNECIFHMCTKYKYTKNKNQWKNNYVLKLINGLE